MIHLLGNHTYFKKLFFYCSILSMMESSVAGHLPEGFVYLKEIDPTIIENLRYLTPENFVGEKMVGYERNCVILSTEAAHALSKVQQELRQDGYSLVVYDAYRPQRTVDFFIRWSEDLSDQKGKETYYPNINKADVFQLGYLSMKSGHSRGSTVDLTLIKTNDTLKPISYEKRQLINNSSITYVDDGTVDMGSSFDLLDIASHHDSEVIDPKYIRLRDFLRTVMKKHGFNEYRKEWWHYVLKDEPFPNTYFNFTVE